MIICPVCEHQQAQGDECENCGKKLVARTQAAVQVSAMPELEQTVIADPKLQVPAAVMQELEQTVVADRKLQVQAAPMTEMEQTRQQAGPDLPQQSVPDLEMTRQAQAGPDLPVQPLQDFDSGRVAEASRPPPRAAEAPAPVEKPEGHGACTKCKKWQPLAEGMVCVTCSSPLYGACNKCKRWQPVTDGFACTVCGSQISGAPAAKPAAAAQPAEAASAPKKKASLSESSEWMPCRDCGARVRPGKRCPSCGTRAAEASS
ncbi:MAG TPA: hypothetical protein VK447_08695 [Myxococcaceae bacterium]|nr:hypothetical protein [Myxococcaceae bacterium]